MKSRWLLPYFLIGVFFGIVLSQGEVISWFRMQEMFRFQGFHMYGVLFSAAAITALGFAVLRRRGQSLSGREITVSAKQFKGIGTQYWLGGLFFGAGWGMTGACPGPIYSLIGNGFFVMILVLGAALLGAWVYGSLQEKLPH